MSYTAGIAPYVLLQMGELDPNGGAARTGPRLISSPAIPVHRRHLMAEYSVRQVRPFHSIGSSLAGRIASQSGSV
jgi:hypothetical protein